MRRLACALLAVVVSTAAADSHLSADPQVNHARSLIHDGRHRDALTILRGVNDAARADITDIRFLTALSAMAVAGRVGGDEKKTLLAEAVAALRAILVEQPTFTRVRLELARAFFLGGDDALARQHFNRVLAGDPPPAMAVNIRRFLHTIRARRRWSGYLSLNLEDNDNINRGAETATIYLFGLPFVVDDEHRRRSGRGVSVASGGEYQHRLARRWRWRVGLDATRSEYAGHEFDQTYLQLRSGPRWLASRRSEAGVQLVKGRRWIARERHSDDFGLQFDARRQVSAKFSVNARASLTDTRHRRRADEDGADADYRINGAWLFTPLVQGNAGVEYVEERWRHGVRNRERGVSVGLGVVLPHGWTLGGEVGWSRKRFGFNAPLTNRRRLDRERTARLFLLNRRLTVAGFSPQLVLTRERQASNSALNDYRRARADLRFVRQF